jgi:hypothetical protein
MSTMSSRICTHNIYCEGTDDSAALEARRADGEEAVRFVFLPVVLAVPRVFLRSALWSAALPHLKWRGQWRQQQRRGDSGGCPLRVHIVVLHSTLHLVCFNPNRQTGE